MVLVDGDGLLEDGGGLPDGRHQAVVRVQAWGEKEQIGKLRVPGRKKTKYFVVKFYSELWEK